MKQFLITSLLLLSLNVLAQTNSTFETLQPVIEEYLSTNLDSSEKYALILLENATKNNDKKDEHHAYNYLAHIQYRRGNKSEALDYFQRSLAPRKLVGKVTEIANTENWIGRIYHEMADYDLALDYYLNALETLHSHPDSSYILQTTNNISKLYLDLGNAEKTNEYNMLSLQIALSINDRMEYANACNLRGIYWQENSAYDSARLYYNKALEIYLQENASSRIAQEYNNLGIINFFMGEYELAYQHFLSAAALRKTFNDSMYYGQSLRNLGDYHFYMGRMDSSEYYYLKSLQIAINTVSNEDLSEVYKSLSELYLEQKDFQQAYHHLSKHTEMNEKIMNISTQKSIQEMEARFAFKNQKEQLELIAANNKKLNRMNEKLEKDKNQKNLLIYLLSAGLAILLFLYYKKVR